MKNLLLLFILSLSQICNSQKSDEMAESLNKKSKQIFETGDLERALPILKQAAEKGSAEAQYNLGYCYQSGIGVAINKTEAVKWFLKSANQGYTDGLYQMMMAYGNGDGVKQDTKKAFSYALKCAENGDSTCMFNIIGCYKSGMGTDKDINKMLEWAIKLGKLENPDDLAKSGYITSARLELAYLYRNGVDVPKDYIQSYQWFLIYNEFKRDFSVIQQDQIIKEIKEVEAQLSEKEKKGAKTLAEQVLNRPLMNIENLYKADF